MAETTNLDRRYDRASGKWRDKMRVLGYYDGYLGFLSAPGQRAESAASVIDIGAGTGAFAEAWVAVNGTPGHMKLLDPSSAMLARASEALAVRGVQADTIAAPLEDLSPADHDEALVAHVIEHFDDPLHALSLIRSQLRPGGMLRLVVSKPHWCNAIIWLQWRHRTFGGDEIRSLIASSGFDLEAEYAFPSGPPSRTSRGLVARAV